MVWSKAERQLNTGGGAGDSDSSGGRIKKVADLHGTLTLGVGTCLYDVGSSGEMRSSGRHSRMEGER